MRQDLFKQLCKIHFHDPKNENPIDSLRKLRLFLEYLIVGYEGNYTPEEHLVIEKFYHSGKQQQSKNNMASKYLCYMKAKQFIY